MIHRQLFPVRSLDLITHPNSYRTAQHVGYLPLGISFPLRVIFGIDAGWEFPRIIKLRSLSDRLRRQLQPPVS